MRVGQIIARLNQKYAFEPKVGGIFFNPFYFARKALYKNIKELGKSLFGCVLDVGAGSQPYKKIISFEKYVSLEYDTPANRKSKRADYFYDGVHFPLPDQSFDSVLTTEVLEHVFTPEIFISEIARILKPGGKLLLTVPFVWDEHEQPYDFARYSSFGLISLLKKNNFEIVVKRKTCSDITVIFQLLNDYIYKKAIGSGNSRRLLLVNILTAFFNLSGLFFNTFLPSNEDLFLDNIILAVKK